MARQTNININVNSTSAVKSIEILKKAFMDLNESIKKTTNGNGKIKLELDTSKIDLNTLNSLVKGLNKMNRAVSSLDASTRSFSQAGQVFNVTNNTIIRSTERSSQGVRRLSSSLIDSTIVLNLWKQGFNSMLSAYKDLSSSTFNVAIADQMTLSNIESLNTVFKNLSSTVPHTASELAGAVDDLIRTGRSYEEATKIIGQVAKLATASGDSLKDTTKIVTKVMSALDISAEKTVETLNSMHSTAIRTASDMGYLASAFKNVAGTASVLVKSANLSEESLEDYKQEVLDLTNSIIGSFANLGLSASQAGTKTKVLYSKLVSMEKTAKSLYDQAIKLNDVRIDGELFDSKNLAKLAKDNLPLAIQKISELYTQGKLSDQVLQKMFTGRHFLDIGEILVQINGNVNSFVDNIAKGVSYSADFYKKMFDINEQVTQLQVNFNNVITSSFGLGESIAGIAMVINDSLKKGTKETSNDFTKISKTLGSMVLSAGTLGLAFNSFKTFLAPLLSSVAYIHPITIAVSGVGAMLALVGKDIYELNKGFADTSILLDNINLKEAESLANLKKSQSYVNQLGLKLKEISKELTIQDSLNEIYVPDYAINMLESLTKNMVEFKKTIESVSKVDILDVNKLQSNLNESSKILEDSLKKVAETRQYLDKQIHDNIQSLIKKDEYRFQDIQVEDVFRADALKPIIDKFFELREAGKNIEEINDALFKMGEEAGISSSRIKKAIKDISTPEIQQIYEDFNKHTEESIKLNKELIDTYDKIYASITKNQEAYSQLVSMQVETKVKIFEKTGKFKDKEGIEAIREIFTSGQLEALQLELAKTYSEKDVLEKKLKLQQEEGSKATNEEIEVTKKLIEDVDKKQTSIYSNLEKQRDSLKSINLEELKGITINRSNQDIALRILYYKTLYNEELEKEKQAKKEGLVYDRKYKDIIQENIKNEIEYAKILDEEYKSKKNQTKYQIKYVNYLKENLDVELELAKIGKTKGEQESLIYSFKLKQLELEEEISKKSLESARISVGNLKVEESLRKKISSIRTAKEGQDFIDNFYATHKNILTGELGEVDKNTYEVLKTVVSALAKVENIQGKIKLEPLKAIREYVDTIPTSITDSIKALQELSDKGLAPYKNYSKQMVEVTEKALIENKNKIWNAYNIDKDTTLAEAIENNMRSLDFARILGENITKNSSEIEKAFVGIKDKIKNNVELSKMYEEIAKNGTIEEKQAFYMKVLNGEHKDLLKHQKDSINNEKDKLELLKKELKLLSSMGDFLSSFGDIFQLKGLGNLGKAISGIKSFKEKEADLGKIEWSNIFDKEEMSKAFETALNNMQMGSAVGTAVGSMIGGGQSAQQGGALGGLLAAGMGLTGWGAVGTAVGGALLGGLFDSSEKDKAEAERRTKEANKLYNKNTEALQKLAQNMSNLSGGVDSLNNTLISAVSKIPTIDNISDVTESMTSMYKTMEKTRKFNNVAYQVTKTKSKKGFLGIGGSSTSWTETIELSVNDMLRRYGFYGAIEDMTSQQIRDFSKWLDNYSLGDSDNFGILADALEDYAEGLDKFEKNIENFFRDTTMEAFVGISSLEQESLRQQIEDFYKNLGFQIDDEMSKQIDKIAEEMSVMVTIMSDVRGEFLNQWMSTGQEAGSVFIKAMSPYIDAMLNNISQIYYDVYFSGINENLEKEFKNLSEQLVELKKQGNKLNWSTVTGKLSESFDKVLTAIINTKNETESFNDILMELQKQAFEAGLSLSEIFDLGLMSGTQKEVMDTFKDALLSSENDSALKSIGELLGDKIGETMANKMIDNLLSDRVLEFSTQIDKIMSGGTNLTFDSLAGLANQALSVGLMMQTEANRLEAIRELFSFDSDIEYTTQNENISYESGTSTQQIYNFYLSSSVEAGNVIESDSVERLADELLDIMLEKLKVDKGIDITKNY